MTAIATPTTNHVAVFDHSGLNIENATANFNLPWIGPEALLVVRPATPENSKYQVASNVRSDKRNRDLASGGAITLANTEQDRKDDRILYPRHVIVGWHGILDKDGKDAPFDLENCKAFIASLPTWIFDRLRIFCMRPERFLDEDDFAEQMELDPAKVAGN